MCRINALAWRWSDVPQVVARERSIAALNSDVKLVALGIGRRSRAGVGREASWDPALSATKGRSAAFRPHSFRLSRFLGGCVDTHPSTADRGCSPCAAARSWDTASREFGGDRVQ